LGTAAAWTRTLGTTRARVGTAATAAAWTGAVGAWTLGAATAAATWLVTREFSPTPRG